MTSARIYDSWEEEQATTKKVAALARRSNPDDLLIGLYGTLEILVDPYTDFAKGTTGIRALQSIDIAVRHPESFAAMHYAIA